MISEGKETAHLQGKESERLINIRPPVICALCLFLGIIWGLVCGIVGYGAEIVPCVVLAAAVIGILKVKNNLIIKFSALVICAALFAFGNVAFSVRLESNLNCPDFSYGTPSLITARCREITYDGEGCKVLFDCVSIEGGGVKTQNQKMLITCETADYLPQKGDIIQFFGNPSAARCLKKGKFDAYLFTEGIGYEYDYELTSGYTFIGRSEGFFDKLHRTATEFIIEKGGASGSVIAALLFGDTSEMPPDVLSAFRASGVAHIFAVSGLHIGFLAAALYVLLYRSRIPKWLSSLIIFAVLLLYSGVCGFSASSLRASVMSFFIMFGTSFGKKTDKLNSVALAALTVLIVSPEQLFDVGFRLSFLTILSIVILYCEVRRALGGMPKVIAAPLATAICAQLGALPVSLDVFGSVAGLGLVVNLLFVPFVGVLYIFALLSAAFSAATGLSAFLYLPSLLFGAITRLFCAIPFGKFEITQVELGLAASLTYYALLIALSGLINIRGRKRMVTAFALGFATLILIISYNL